MPDSVSQKIADLLLQHDVDLLRVMDGTETQIEQAVHQITRAIVAKLAELDPTAPVRIAFRRQRLSRIIDESRAISRSEYRKIYRLVRKELIALAQEETESFTEIVNQGIGVNAVTSSLNAAVVRDIVDERAITANVKDAEKLRGFFEREAAAHHKRVSGTLLQGFADGDNLSQMIARINAIEGIQARESIGIARTAYNHVTTNVRIEMMQRNANLFRGVIAIAVLDGKTTPICISRSNAMWDLNTGNALPESPVKTRFPGPTPWHFAERTQLYPLTKGVGQLGRGSQRLQRAIRNLPKEQRDLLNIDPPRQESYDQWLKRQPESVQLQALGRARRELWLQGKLSLRDLVTQRGRPLTLKELAKKRQNP